MKKGWPAFFLLAVLVFPPLLDAQWAKAYGLKRDDEAACIQQTSDGGFIVVGKTDLGSIWMVKLNASGTIRWQKTIDMESSHSSAGYYVGTTRDNGYILTGWAFWGGPRDILLACKLNDKGDARWQTYIMDPDTQTNTSQTGQAVQQTSDGGYVFTGYQKKWDSDFVSETGDDLLVCKSDSQGKKRWSYAFGGPDTDYGRSIQETPDGGFIVAGFTKSFGAGDSDFWVLKLRSDGKLEWSSTYGGNDLDEAHEVRRTSDGGYIVVGPTKSFGAGDYDIWLLKINGQGLVQWQKTYGGPKADYGHSAYPTPDGGFIVAGSTSSFGSGGFDGWIFKLDSWGLVQWEKTYGGKSQDSLFAVRPIQGGGYVAAGRTQSFGAGKTDALVMKLGKTGNISSPSGSFVRVSHATVLDSAGTALWDDKGGSKGPYCLWVTPTIPLKNTKCVPTVIRKK